MTCPDIIILPNADYFPFGLARAARKIFNEQRADERDASGAFHDCQGAMPQVRSAFLGSGGVRSAGSTAECRKLHSMRIRYNLRSARKLKNTGFKTWCSRRKCRCER